MDFSKYDINRSTPIPLYYQLKKIISTALESGELTEGDILPTEVEFSDMYGLSRTTVRQAIGELVSEGKLYREKSKGTFVSKPKIVSSFMQNLDSFSSQMQGQNVVPRVELLSRALEPVPVDVSDALKIEPNTKMIHIYRRRFANDEPILVVHNYLPAKCAYLLETDFEQCALYETIFSHDANFVSKFVRTIQATPASPELARLLLADEGSPIQHATSIGYDLKNRPVDYAVVDYRGDKNIFVVEFNADGARKK